MAAWTGIFLLSHSVLQAEVDDEIPLGIEAVTGFRTNYVHRGFELAETALDFQLETELSLSDENSLHLGLAHLAESDGDFNETSIYAEISHSLNDHLIIGASLTYRDRNASILDSGFELGAFATFSINDDWLWRSELNYDFGISGLYLASELEWSQVLSDKSFVAIEAGISVVSSYLDRSGFNDLYTRVTYTYAISDRISLTPFLGTTLQLNDHDGSDLAFGGLWFEVNF